MALNARGMTQNKETGLELEVCSEIVTQYVIRHYVDNAVEWHILDHLICETLSLQHILQHF